MKSFILAGGNPPIPKELLQTFLNESVEELTIVVLTLYRQGWESYVKNKYIDILNTIKSCHFEIVLGDVESEKSIIKSIQKADLLIIGGGDTLLYHKTYYKGIIREAILKEYNGGLPIIGLSAGAIIMGDKIAISPKDNSFGIPIYDKGIGIYDDFLIGVHYSKWNDRLNLEKAKKETKYNTVYGIDDESYIMFNEKTGYSFLGSVHIV